MPSIELTEVQIPSNPGNPLTRAVTPRGVSALITLQVPVWTGKLTSRIVTASLITDQPIFDYLGAQTILGKNFKRYFPMLSDGDHVKFFLYDNSTDHGSYITTHIRLTDVYGSNVFALPWSDVAPVFELHPNPYHLHLKDGPCDNVSQAGFPAVIIP